MEGRSCTAARLSSGSSPSRPDTDNMESGGCLTRYHPPLAPQYRPSCVLDGPSRPPSHGHRIPEHPLRSPLDPAGTTPPPPGVLRGSPHSRPWGSIGWLATRGRSSRASAPSPAPATQDSASEKRPRGSGPRPDSAPSQPGRRRRTGPFRSRPPLHSRVGGGELERALLPPAAALGTQPHPRSSPLAKYPLGRALNHPRAARPGEERALHWGGGWGWQLRFG